MTRFIPPVVVGAARLARALLRTSWHGLCAVARGLRGVRRTYLSAGRAAGRGLFGLLGQSVRLFVPPIVPLPRQRRPLSHAVGVVGLALAIVFAGMGLGVSLAVLAPSREDLLFDRMLVVARVADEAFDREVMENGSWTPEVFAKAELPAYAEPVTEIDLLTLQISIIAQIYEETGIPPRVVPVRLFNAWINSPAAFYSPFYDLIALNPRYFYDAGWRNNDMSWLHTLVHEEVHAQGVWVGESAVLEAETETITYEVVAALGNRNYPYARAAFLDRLRRDALLAAYYLANGQPVRATVHEDPGMVAPVLDADRLARYQAAREAIFTPFERRVTDKRMRWWLGTGPNEGGGLENYLAVLHRYVMPVVAVVQEGCGDGVLNEDFEFYTHGVWTLTDLLHMVFGLTPPGVQEHSFRLQVDDAGYALREIGAC